MFEKIKRKPNLLKKPCENKTVISHGFFSYAFSISLLSCFATKFCLTDTIYHYSF